MIPVRIGTNLKPFVELEISGKTLTFVLDTGFNGVASLAILSDDLKQLPAEWFGWMDLTYANGTSETVDLYALDVSWAGEERSVHVCEIRVADSLAQEHRPANLLGTRMLDGQYLALSIREHGEGSITPLP